MATTILQKSIPESAYGTIQYSRNYTLNCAKYDPDPTELELENSGKTN